MCFKLGIVDHITTTEYRPQGNIAERHLRNLKSALIAYHANDHTSWDQNLSWIQFAFNSAYHEGHKSTPFELLFKYKPVRRTHISQIKRYHEEGNGRVQVK